MNYHDILAKVIDSDGKSDWITATRGDRMVHFNIADVDLRVEYSLDASFTHEEAFVAPWANCFSETESSSYYVNLVYRSTMLQEFVLVFVDDADVGLPLPDAGTMQIAQLHYRVAQIVNRGGALDDYIARAGLTVMP
jgi:hypothetical protein